MPTKEEILQSNGVYYSGKIDGPTHEAILKSMDDWKAYKQMKNLSGMIPNNIKNEIVGEANWRSTNGHGGVDDITRDNFILAAEYGYLLSVEQPQEVIEQQGKELLYSENENFATWNILFYAALKELCDLKFIKDTHGKTDDYLERQPAAWEKASELIRMFDSEMLTIKNSFKDEWYAMESEIEKAMETFDMEKRIKAAQAIEDLRKFIITA